VAPWPTGPGAPIVQAIRSVVYPTEFEIAAAIADCRLARLRGHGFVTELPASQGRRLFSRARRSDVLDLALALA